MALHRLTVLLNEQDFSKLTVQKAKAYSSVAAIDKALWIVNNPVLTEVCSQEHHGMRAVRNQERPAILVCAAYHSMRRRLTILSAMGQGAAIQSQATQ